MTIVERLEELWKRLLYCLAAFGVATAAGYLFVERILAVGLWPVGQVVFLALTEAFFVRLKAAAWRGGSRAFPGRFFKSGDFSLCVALRPRGRAPPGPFHPASRLFLLRPPVP